MANVFAITTATADIKANNDGKAAAVFTVTNNSNKPVRGIAKAKALENTQQDWLTVDGENERDFAAHGTQQLTVNFAKPVAPAAPGDSPRPPEKFPFRLDVASAVNPDEVFTEGPQVTVEVTPPLPPPVKKPFPWWLIAVIGAVVLVVAIVLVVLLTRGTSGPGNNTPPPTPTPASVVEVINFYDRSPTAAWRGHFGEVLPFNGSDGDSRGFVKLRDGSTMENGTPSNKVLQTHPAWFNGGIITGTYPLDIPIRSGDRFRATVGFLQGAGAGNLTLRVLINNTPVYELQKQYTGSLRELDVDLNPYVGQGGNFSLQVAAIPTSAQGWICWINPRIMNERR